MLPLPTLSILREPQELFEMIQFSVVSTLVRSNAMVPTVFLKGQLINVSSVHL